MQFDGDPLRVRACAMIEFLVPPERRFKELEERTGISGATWRSFWNRPEALPSGAMLSALCGLAPDYVLWLLTGSTARKDVQLTLRRPRR